jgi:hypothetical protein
LRLDVGGVRPPRHLVGQVVDGILGLGKGRLELRDLLPLLDERLERRGEHEQGGHDEPEHRQGEAGQAEIAQPCGRPALLGEGHRHADGLVTPGHGRKARR